MSINQLDKMVSGEKPCKICRLLSGKFQATEIDTPWLINENYAAMVSIGSMVPGWGLICPTQHQLNLCQNYQNSAFWDFTTDVVQIISQYYGEVRLFEHGAFFQDSITNCGTGHAHLHVVPLKFSLEIESQQFGGDFQWKYCNASEIASIVEGKEYLFVADHYKGEQTRGLITVLNKGISQFFRQVIADQLGKTEYYDYRRYPMLENSQATAINLHRICSRLQCLPN